jgi:hypothetical protein
MKFILSESEKSHILQLHEFYKKNFVGTSIKKNLSETKEIQGKGTDPYDYKKDGSNYYFRKNGGPWMLSSGNAKVAIARLFGDTLNYEDRKTNYEKFFSSVNQGNLFRKWTRKFYPNIAKENDLEAYGPFDNNNILKTASQVVRTKDGSKIKLGKLFFKQNKKAKFVSEEPGETLPSLVKTGFHIDKNSFDPDKGYYVNKCTQEGCAQYTYDMIGKKFGDAWQAYQSFDVNAKVDSDTVKKMEQLFNNINKSGSPQINQGTENDTLAKEILFKLIPNQSQFSDLGLGTVVGLYYPDSENFDLAFYQSAIGKFRDASMNWYSLRSPYFCKDSKKCSSTLWKPSDEGSGKFVAGPTLKGGKSFIPNTHLGFIGYIDENGVPYVVHNIHKKVYAFPVDKMKKGKTLAIIWAGNPNQVK